MRIRAMFTGFNCLRLGIYASEALVLGREKEMGETQSSDGGREECEYSLRIFLSFLCGDLRNTIWTANINTNFDVKIIYY
jgi:hypothetical protein